MKTMGVLRNGVLAIVAGLSISSRPSLFAEPDTSVTPFKYEAPRSALEDLKQRLKQTRWPERETVNDWSQGVPVAKLRELVEYWSGDYDWRRCEAKLNSFPQFGTVARDACKQDPSATAYDARGDG
jgi:Epoxide hydrolase N terminus.